MESGFSEGSAGREDPPSPPKGGTKSPPEDDITVLEPPPAPEASKREDPGDKVAGKRPMTVLMPPLPDRDRVLMRSPPDHLHLQDASATAGVAAPPITWSSEMNRLRVKPADIKPSVRRRLFVEPGDDNNIKQLQSQHLQTTPVSPAAQQQGQTQSQLQGQIPPGYAYRGPIWVRYVMGASESSLTRQILVPALVAAGGGTHQQQPQSQLQIRPVLLHPQPLLRQPPQMQSKIRAVLPTVLQHQQTLPHPLPQMQSQIRPMMQNQQTLPQPPSPSQIRPVLRTVQPQQQQTLQQPQPEMPSSFVYWGPTSGSTTHGASASSRQNLVAADASGGGNRPRHTPAWWKAQAAERRRQRVIYEQWKAAMQNLAVRHAAGEKLFDEEDEEEEEEEEEDEEDEEEEEKEEEEEEQEQAVDDESDGEPDGQGKQQYQK